MTSFYFGVIDKLVSELQSCFLAELVDFSCLDPHHFTALDGKQQVRHLVNRYQVNPDTTASQWRLLSHLH